MARTINGKQANAEFFPTRKLQNRTLINNIKRTFLLLASVLKGLLAYKQIKV